MIYSAYYSNESGSGFVGSFSTQTNAEEALRKDQVKRSYDLIDSYICCHELDSTDIDYLDYHGTTDDWH
jgi:hypothetical protein